MVRQKPSNNPIQSPTNPIKRGRPVGSRTKTKQFVSNHKDKKETSTRKLTNKQECFVREYLIDLNATQAAIRAGYSAVTAEVIGCNLLSHIKVSERIKIALDERGKETKVDANYVLTRLREIDEMDALDILEDDGSIKSIRDWPKIWRQFISGFEVVEMFAGKGDDKVIAGMLKKIKWPDKTKNLELIGKHVNVQAFRDRIEHTGLGGGPIQQEIKITSVDPIEASKQYQSLIEGM